MTAEYILNGKRLSLRLLSAKEFLMLNAKKEEFEQEYFDMGIQNDDALFCAVLIASCLFEGDAPAFSSADEVLNSLSLEQLYTFKEAYDQLESANTGKLVTHDDLYEHEPYTYYSSAIFKDRYFNTFPVFSDLSVKEISDAIQCESLRRFRNTGGELIDR